MANFTKPMKWNNKGIEPSETLKNQGFKGGYKPPAEVFNYFLNNSEICIDELQKATDEAQRTADGAKTAADKAQGTANSAATAASSAQSTADSAGTAALLAQTAANNAQSAADGAKTVADKAQSTADEAQSTAENAKAAAAEAQTTAEGKADGTHKHKKSDITDFPTSMTPTSHASTNTTYGTGNSSNYGHVKLSDSTTSTSGVSGGIAATPAAVKSVKTVADEAKSTADNAKTAADEAQSTAENAKAAAAEAQTTAEGKADGTHKHKKSDITDFPTSMTPTSHASTNTTYGTGNSSNYGHVKLSDSTTSTSGVSSGVAATPAAVKSVKEIAEHTDIQVTSFNGTGNPFSKSITLNFVPTIIKLYYASSASADVSLCKIYKPASTSSVAAMTVLWEGHHAGGITFTPSTKEAFYTGGAGYYVLEAIK